MCSASGETPHSGRSTRRSRASAVPTTRNNLKWQWYILTLNDQNKKVRCLIFRSSSILKIKWRIRHRGPLRVKWTHFSIIFHYHKIFSYIQRYFEEKNAVYLLAKLNKFDWLPQNYNHQEIILYTRYIILSRVTASS